MYLHIVCTYVCKHTYLHRVCMYIPTYVCTYVFMCIFVCSRHCPSAPGWVISFISFSAESTVIFVFHGQRQELPFIYRQNY